jgi:hypothetical protein
VTGADAGDYVRTVASFTDDTGQTATASSSGTPIGGGAGITVFDTTTGQPVSATGQSYTGPVGGIQNQYINITSDSLNVGTSTPNWYIHTGDGNDGINVSAGGGNNILDGEGGSNFLVGGRGNDTFYVNDLYATVPSWTTIVGFHIGDAATVWGVPPDDFKLSWMDGGGAPGYTGLTLYATAAKKPEVAVTIAGATVADMHSGLINVQFGQAGGNNYMEISRLT